MTAALSEQHALSVTERFTDTEPPQALLDVRGKAILRPPSGTPVIGQFDASAYDVAKHMEVAAIPDDIKTFLSEMAALV